MSWSGCANLHCPRITSPLAHNVMTASDPSTYFADADRRSPCDSAAASAASSPSPPPSPISGFEAGSRRARLTIALKCPRNVNDHAPRDSGATAGTEEAEGEQHHAPPESASQESPDKDEQLSLSPRDNEEPVSPPGALPSTTAPSTTPPLTSLALALLSAQAHPQPPPLLPPNLDPQLLLSYFRSWPTTAPTPRWHTSSQKAENDASPPTQDPHSEPQLTSPTKDSLAEHHNSIQSIRNLKRKASELHEESQGNDGDMTTKQENGDIEEGEIGEAEHDERALEFEAEKHNGEGEDEYEPPTSSPPQKRRSIRRVVEESRRQVEDSAMMRKQVVEHVRYAWWVAGIEAAEAEEAGEREAELEE